MLPCFPHRLWNKETFDHLLGYLGSPEVKEMGLFLISGYNLFTRPVPVRSRARAPGRFVFLPQQCSDRFQMAPALCLVTLRLELGVFWLPQCDICPKDGLRVEAGRASLPTAALGMPWDGAGQRGHPPSHFFPCRGGTAS